jgi:hypothetical protein
MEAGNLKRIDRPWLSVALPILGCFGGGSLYGWSGLMPAVQSAFATGSAAASMVFSLALVSFMVGVLIRPMLLFRVPHRLQLSVIAFGTAASLAAASLAPVFWIFVTAYSVGFGLSSGALYSHAIAHATSSASPGIWVPVSVAAFGLGGVVFGPMNIWLTELGWSIRSVLPAMCCILAVAVLALLSPVAAYTGSSQRKGELPFVRPDRTIFQLWAIFATGSCAGLIVLGLASTFLVNDPAAQATAVFAVAAGNTIGRLSASLVASRFGPAFGIMGALSLSALALAGLALTSGSGVVTALLFVVALSYGQVASQAPLLVSRYVSAAAFGGAFGWVFTG